MNDDFYMRRALRLAKRGECLASPNPMVGTVIVRNDHILGEGYHRCCGEEHAEINAIRRASEPIAGATFYVTLEPCVHFGKTPPCVDAIVERRPARVVIGTSDPNPLIAGRGIATLRQHGIQTTVGVLEEECRRLNERFFKFIQTRTPFITLKYAQSLDGRIATATGHSRWISSPSSLRLAHRLRSTHDAILVGVTTVIQDNPELTVRLVRGRNPLRIVADSRLHIPLTAKLMQDQDTAKTIVATTARANQKKLEQLGHMGIETLLIDENPHHHVDLGKLFVELGKKGISSVLVEGGAGIITSVLKSGLANRLVVVIAPKIIGKGIAAVGDLGVREMTQALGLAEQRISRRGVDLIIDGRIKGQSLFAVNGTPG